MNFQIFTVCTGKAFMYFTGDFFKPLYSTSSVHYREGCLKTQNSVAVSVPHNHFCTSLELWVQSGASLKIQQEQVFSSNRASKDVFHFMSCDDVLYCFVSCKPSAVPFVKSRKSGYGKTGAARCLFWVWLCQPDRVFPSSWTFPLVIPWVKAATDPWKRSPSPLISG